jgi:hypothetical protein
MGAGLACIRISGAIACLAIAAACPAHADPRRTLTFAVTRNDSQIGTDTITLGQNGPQRTIESVTHVSVGMAFITLYKFDQTETEQWANGRLMALNVVTDDNGTVHRIVADIRGDKLVVDSDGLVKEIASTVIPASLWDPQLLQQAAALDPESGSVVPVSVVDCGEDSVVISGRSERAHHFVIRTNHASDVWYDDNHSLVKVELKGSDGSTIRYELT